MSDSERKQRFLEDMLHFVRIPSRSFPAGGEEGALQAAVAARMRALQARVRMIEAGEVPGFREHPLCHGPDRMYAGRPTVVGEIGPAGAPALLVLAHSDTVEVNRPASWTVDPFAGIRREGLLIGLGVGDDKWGTAALLSIMETLQCDARRCPLPKRVIFASTIDEEHGVGNGTLLLMLAGLRAEAALYLDGTRWRIRIGCNGGSHLMLRPRGPVPPVRREQHERRLAAMAGSMSRRRQVLYDQPYFRDNDAADSSVRFTVREEGGSFVFQLPFYNPPGEDPRTFEREIRAALEETLGKALAGYTLTIRHPWFEPALVPEDTPLVGHLKAAIGEVTGKPAQVSTISKQDSFVLTNHAGIPTVSFGVSRVMDPGGSHAPDEAIDAEEAWTGLCAAENAVRRWLEAPA